ncbi:hypothetical protein J3R30DRAFT_2427882 [Lentinula aciculospora]|uniref:Uncharacterized protein n=1 Tax=Lentinula aciculospora TaxID=153920 RepID=A0A9W9AG24_9AGAR|nr:hypothetical protein J3R30DRAFT_2427882 [Lentinula aciculospora]
MFLHITDFLPSAPVPTGLSPRSDSLLYIVIFSRIYVCYICMLHFSRLALKFNIRRCVRKLFCGNCFSLCPPFSSQWLYSIVYMFANLFRPFSISLFGVFLNFGILIFSRFM